MFFLILIQQNKFKNKIIIIIDLKWRRNSFIYSKNINIYTLKKKSI